MRVILKISALLLICSLVYKCQKTEYVPELQNDDEDEIGWIGEDFTGEDLTERASTFKISQVVGTDSLPVFQVANPTKKQKFGKRQIISTTAKTRFTIRGIGFGVRNDSSSVKCYIKKVEQSGIDIVSWDSTQVVVDFPVLTSQLLIDNTFSIQFKLFVKNANPIKASVSRSRSRSCISSVKAASLNSTGGSGYSPYCDSTIFVNYLYSVRKDIVTNCNKSIMNQNALDITSSYVPRVGDIIVKDAYRNSNFYHSNILVVTELRANKSFIAQSIPTVFDQNSNCNSPYVTPLYTDVLTYTDLNANVRAYFYSYFYSNYLRE